MTRSTRLGAILLSVITTACGSEVERARPAAMFDTLAGGAVRVRGPAEGVWRDAERWLLDEQSRVGSMEGSGPDVFGQIWAITADASDRLYVLDRQARQVGVFDRDGRHVRTFGREGRGPGEFVDPFGFAWDAMGRVWVVDVRQARYSVFDTAGAPVREYPRRVGGFSWPWPGRFDARGLLYEATFMAGGVQPILAFRPEEDLVAVDTFPHALGTLQPGDFFDLRDDQGLGAIVGMPFGRRSEWALDRNGEIWVGHSSHYTLVRRNLDGDTLLVMERDVMPAPVSGEERAAAIEGLGDQLQHPKMDVGRIPATKPFFERLLPDDDGNLWVLREGDGTAWFFDVFGRDGSFLGAVDLPVKPELFPPPRIGAHAVFVVTRDSLDVQYVIRYGINRGPVARGPG